MKRFCVLGSVNMDMVTKVKSFPRPGETLVGTAFGTFPGGKGANQAVALGRLGAEVQMVGRVGDDLFGHQYLSVLEAEGVGSAHLEAVAGATTGVATIEVNAAGENHIIVVPGANDLVDEAFVEAHRAAIEEADLLLLQLEVPLPAVIAAARLAKAAGKTVILDPAPARPLPPALLALVDIVTPNETEAQILTGIDTATETGVRAAGEALLTAGAGKALIKAGGRGAFLVEAGRMTAVPGFKVAAVDTTAAGDSFNAGLAFALGGGSSLPEAIRFANAVGALSTTKDGAQPAMPTLAEVEALRAAQG